MRKKTIVILYILSNVFFAVCLVDIFVINVLAAPYVSQCSPNCAPPELLKVPVLLIGSIVLGGCYLASFALGITVVICVLVKQVKQQQWVWFVCTWLFGFFPAFGDIYILIYLIVAPVIPQPPQLHQEYDISPGPNSRLSL